MNKNCKQNCIGGDSCVLRCDVGHTMHICDFEGCECHSIGRPVVVPDRRVANAWSFWLDMRTLLPVKTKVLA